MDISHFNDSAQRNQYEVKAITTYKFLKIEHAKVNILIGYNKWGIGNQSTTLVVRLLKE